jgi:two-component system nitrogen regulation response regulator GlnG/two-component system response regulator HydG
MPTVTGSTDSHEHDEDRLVDRFALVIAWCASDPSRVGEVFLLPALDMAQGAVIGRSSAGRDEGVLILGPIRQRPGKNEPCKPLMDPRISRHQLLVVGAEGGRVEVQNVGRCPLVVNGRATDRCAVQPGDTLLLRSALLLFATTRPERLPDLQNLERSAIPAFGEADAFGGVGESPMAWAMRDMLAFLAKRTAHVLLHGESGSGKELAARAVHGLSTRARAKLVARNAATIPAGLIDAELFGNIKDYPNPGMPDRPGLIGESDRSTLFLDEIGEIPEEMQAHLLRVLDSGGEYHRLGEARTRRSDIRLVAATNRAVTALKPDLLARLKLRMQVPGLNERREDIPLLIRHLLRKAVADDPEIARRFCTDGEPRASASLTAALVGHLYTHHVRELESLLWRAISTSPKDRIELTPAVIADLEMSPSTDAGDANTGPTGSVRPDDLTREAIEAALERQGGVLERVWRDLGLKNRFQLLRLIKKHGLRRAGEATDETNR